MRNASVAQRRMDGTDLYEQIGAFLATHRLSPEPAHYSFAYGVLTDPGGALAGAVARLTEDGVRLSRHDIEALGGTVSTGVSPVAMTATSPRTVPPAPQPGPPPEQDRAERLVAETQAQVDGFATMMRAMQDETRGFGRDLAESAAAIHRTPSRALDEIARVAGGMIARIHDAESRLAQATEETDALREKLAEARDTARRDPLTGMPNRRAFAEAFAARDPAVAPWCLAVCDIDRFKRVNDQFGHAVGDRVLDAIGRTLAESCGGQLVCRYGGEEFVILIGGLDLAAATDYVDGARAAVAAKRFRNRETGASLGDITISGGVIAIQPGEDADAACARADRLLYAAKAAGRDRVCAA